MTVAELIECLRDQPQDAEVYCRDGFFNGYALSEVELEVTRDPTDRLAIPKLPAVVLS